MSTLYDELYANNPSFKKLSEVGDGLIGPVIRVLNNDTYQVFAQAHYDGTYISTGHTSYAHVTSKNGRIQQVKIKFGHAGRWAPSQGTLEQEVLVANSSFLERIQAHIPDA